MKRIAKYIALLLAVAVAAGLAACSSADDSSTNNDTDNGDATNGANPNAPSDNAEVPTQAAALSSNLMAGVAAAKRDGKQPDDTFTAAMADFSIGLFKRSIADPQNAQNTLVSPLSVMLALSMTANGAQGETLAQMEALLGGGISLDDLNKYLYTYANNLPSEEKSILKIANSIWLRDDGERLRVNDAFLQKNADYYGAAAFRAAFDAQTVSDINEWVDTNTDGMIPEILSEIDDSHMLYLVNALMFDAEWQRVYCKEDVRDGDFHGAKYRHVEKADFMHSTEGLYLDDGNATGFLKPYAGGAYSFAALLPNEWVPIEEYVETLTGEGFLRTLNSARETTVFAALPKFEYDYSVLMNDTLKNLGIPLAFDRESADFTLMAESTDGNIYIDAVLHKTFISVDELGTKAGAVTMVAMAAAGAPLDIQTVTLDRPFVFAIVDNATNLPVFIGTVITVE